MLIAVILAACLLTTGAAAYQLPYAYVWYGEARHIDDVNNMVDAHSEMLRTLGLFKGRTGSDLTEDEKQAALPAELQRLCEPGIGTKPPEATE